MTSTPSPGPGAGSPSLCEPLGHPGRPARRPETTGGRGHGTRSPAYLHLVPERSGLFRRAVPPHLAPRAHARPTSVPPPKSELGGASGGAETESARAFFQNSLRMRKAGSACPASVPGASLWFCLIRFGPRRRRVWLQAVARPFSDLGIP